MPGDESIFKNIELPALKAGGKVTKIIRFPPSSDDPTKSDNEFWSPAQEAATEIVVTAGVTGVGTETGLGVLPSLHD